MASFVSFNLSTRLEVESDVPRPRLLSSTTVMSTAYSPHRDYPRGHIDHHPRPTSTNGRIHPMASQHPRNPEPHGHIVRPLVSSSPIHHANLMYQLRRHGLRKTLHLPPASNPRPGLLLLIFSHPLLRLYHIHLVNHSRHLTPLNPNHHLPKTQKTSSKLSILLRYTQLPRTHITPASLHRLFTDLPAQAGFLPSGSSPNCRVTPLDRERFLSCNCVCRRADVEFSVSGIGC